MADNEVLILSITQDDGVQFWWALVCASLDNDLAEMLLQKIAQLWITIRGYSYASSIVEQYKQSMKNILQKKRAFRKDLKLKSVK